MKNKQAPDIIPYGIPHLTVENSSICNIRCKFCKSQRSPEHVKALLPEEMFEKIVDAADKIRVIHFTGSGEPLTDPNFTNKVKRVKACGAMTRITSNGSLLKPEITDRLLELGHDQIFISFEGWGKDIYNSIMVGSDFDTTVANLRYLGKRIHETGAKTEVTMGMMGMQANIHTLPDVLRFASEMGFMGLNLQAMMGDSDFTREQTLLRTPDTIVTAYLEAEKLAKEYGLIFQCYYPYKHVLDDYFETDAPQAAAHYLQLGTVPAPERTMSGEARLCSFPWFYFTVDCQANVYPCCHAAGFVHTLCEPIPPLGNLIETSLLDLWNGDFMRALRRGFLDGDMINPCRTCDLHRFCTPDEINELAERVSRTNCELMEMSNESCEGRQA